MDYFDMLRLLSEHPEWRGELRRTLFPADFESLPDAQRRTEQRVGRLEEAVTRLAEAQQRTEERLLRLEGAIERLAEAQQRTEQAVRELAAALERTDERVGRLDVRVDRLETKVDRLQVDVVHLKGHDLERTYREEAAACFATMVKRPRALSREALSDLAQEAFSGDELHDLVRLDLVVRGRLPGKGETPEVLLAVEVSAVLDEGDVERAVRRAGLLRRAGNAALPVVAGPDATPAAEAAAQAQSVAVVRNGTVALWDEALAAWLPATQTPRV